MRDVLAANHEASTFALTCTCAAVAGVPPLGCVTLAALGACFGDWPDIDMPGSRITKALCLVRYPVWDLDDDHLPKRHLKGKKKGKIKLSWRSFPGHQLHRLSERASSAVFDLCATEADKADVVPMWGPKFRTHRGLTHSVWFALGTALIVGLLVPMIGSLIAEYLPTLGRANLAPIFGTEDLRVLLPTTAFVGTFGHVLGDCCTDYACAPFAPVWRWNGRRYVEMGLWEPMRFKVSNWVEKVVVAPICLAAAGVSVLGALGWLSAVLSAAGRLWSALGTA